MAITTATIHIMAATKTGMPDWDGIQGAVLAYLPEPTPEQAINPYHLLDDIRGIRLGVLFLW